MVLNEQKFSCARWQEVPRYLIPPVELTHQYRLLQDLWGVNQLGEILALVLEHRFLDLHDLIHEVAGSKPFDPLS